MRDTIKNFKEKLGETLTGTKSPALLDGHKSSQAMACWHVFS